MPQAGPPALMDEDVEAAEGAGCFVNRLGGGVHLGDVGGDEVAFASGGGDQSQGFRRVAVVVAAVDRHVAALAGQVDGDRSADAFRAAGHQSAFIGEIHEMAMLLADAERLKDTVQQVVGVDCADNFAKLGERDADFGGDQFVAAAGDGDFGRPVDGGVGQANAVAATVGRRGDAAGSTGGGIRGEQGGNRAGQLVEALAGDAAGGEVRRLRAHEVGPIVLRSEVDLGEDDQIAGCRHFCNVACVGGGDVDAPESHQRLLAPLEGELPGRRCDRLLGERV